MWSLFIHCPCNGPSTIIFHLNIPSKVLPTPSFPSLDTFPSMVHIVAASVSFLKHMSGHVAFML